MRRFWRLILNGLAILSLALAIASTLMLIRGFFVTDYVQCFRENAVNAVTDQQDSYVFAMGLRGLSFERAWMSRTYQTASIANSERAQFGFNYDNQYHTSWSYLSPRFGLGGPKGIRILGFFYRRIGHSMSDPWGGGFDIMIPWPASILLFAILPLIVWRWRSISRRRESTGLCSK